MGPTGIEPVPTASETIVLSIGLRAQFSHGVDGDSSSNLNGLASIVFKVKNSYCGATNQRYHRGMKKLIVLVIAIVSGISLCADIFIIDLLPFLDEAILLAIFTKSVAYLGFDVTRFIPFMRKKGKAAAPTSPDDRSAPIDV